MKQFEKQTIALLTVVCLCLSLSACIENPNIADSNSPYNQYVIYDPHLQCREVDRTEIIRSQRPPRSVRYFLIPGESSNQFICGDFGATLFGRPDPYILQNPENYIDVLEEWTIRSVELYADDSNNPAVSYDDTDEFARNYRILLGSFSAEAISELKTAMNSEKIEFVSTEGDRRIGAGHCKFYLQINFEQHENIVWEMSVNCFEREDGRVLRGCFRSPNSEKELYFKEFYADLTECEQLTAETFGLIEAYLSEQNS